MPDAPVCRSCKADQDPLVLGPISPYSAAYNPPYKLLSPPASMIWMSASPQNLLTFPASFAYAVEQNLATAWILDG